jgi:hypothetical protein
MNYVRQKIQEQPWFLDRAKVLANQRNVSLETAKESQLIVEINNFIYDSMPLHRLNNPSCCNCGNFNACPNCQAVVDEIVVKYGNYPN